MMKDREEAVGMISVAQEIQMICAEKFCAYILKMMARTQFLKAIYLRKEHRIHVRKFISWAIAIHGVFLLTVKPVGCIGAKLVLTPLLILFGVRVGMMNLTRQKKQEILGGHFL